MRRDFVNRNLWQCRDEILEKSNSAIWSKKERKDNFLYKTCVAILRRKDCLNSHKCKDMLNKLCNIKKRKTIKSTEKAKINLNDENCFKNSWLFM